MRDFITHVGGGYILLGCVVWLARRLRGVRVRVLDPQADDALRTHWEG